MRVLWAVKGLGPGGAERLLVSTAGALATTTPELGIECVYVVARKDHLAADLERVGVATTSLSRSHRDPRWPLRLARTVRSGEWDVVHVHSPLIGVVARLATVGLRARPGLVTTEHNAWDTFRAPTRWANRWTIGRDDAVLAVSTETARSMRGRAARQVRVVRHGIDVGAVRAAAEQREIVRRELGLAPDDVVVVNVANFREQKDHTTLLRALSLLVERGVRFRAVVVGQGPLESRTRSAATELGLDDVVTFTGFRADAVRVLAGADVFVLSSLWEGLPVALMEAAALGVPIVSTGVGGVAETVADGVQGLLVEPAEPVALADALESVVDDPDLRLRLGAASRDLGDTFDVDAAASVIVETYRSVARNHTVASGEATASAIEPARRRRPPPTGVEIRRAGPDDTPAILHLMATTLGWTGPWAPRLFRWKHLENPFGESPLWVAEHDGAVIGVRAFLRWRFRRGDEVLTAVRAVDTATHPDHRGAGLFTALTLHGLDALRDEGIDFVFNTPNDQSRPGYLKMGWIPVGQLAVSALPRSPLALLAMARSRQPAELETMSVAGGVPFATWFANAAGRPQPPADVRALATDADDAYLHWRFGLQELDYRVVEAGTAAVVVRARRRGTATELVHAATFGDRQDEGRALRAAVRALGADHALSLGPARLADGRIPVPGVGPTLTWRALRCLAAPPLPNWALTMGDVELF